MIVKSAESPTMAHQSLEAHKQAITELQKKYTGDLKVGPQYADLLNQEFDQLKTRSVLTKGEAIVLATKLAQAGQTGQFYRATLREIKTQTATFHELEEAGMFYNLLNGFGYPEAAGVKLDWSTSLDFIGTAQYDPITNIASFKYPRPDAVITLVYLAISGKMPEQVDLVGHEVRHKLHKPPIGFRRKTYFKQAPDTEIREAFAYRTADQQPHYRTQDYTVKHILTAKDRGMLVYPDVNRTRLEAAVNWVDQMNAMGNTVGYIGDSVRWSGKWDQYRGVYTRAEKRRRRVMNDLYLDDNGLARLVSLDVVERKVDQQKARILTTELLKQAVGQQKYFFAPFEQARVALGGNQGSHLGNP